MIFVLIEGLNPAVGRQDDGIILFTTSGSCVRSDMVFNCSSNLFWQCRPLLCRVSWYYYIWNFGQILVYVGFEFPQDFFALLK
jgi:hypothetical protein